MEPEILGSCGKRSGAIHSGGSPESARRAARRRTSAGRLGPTAKCTPRMVDGRAEDRHPWAVVALVVPLLFCAIVGMGVFLMFHRNMGYFKPAPSGRSDAPAPALAVAPPAPLPGIEIVRPGANRGHASTPGGTDRAA